MIRRSPVLLSIVLIILLLCAGPLMARDEAGENPLVSRGLEALIARALAENPEVKAASERQAMAEEKAKQAGALEDPMLMVKLQNGVLREPFAFDRDGTTAKVVGVTQALPFYGKRDLRRQGAGLDAQAEGLRVVERKLEIRRMVKEAWYGIAGVDRSLEVLTKNIDTLDDLLRFSETMYGVGKGLQQDVLKAQLERSKMEEMRLDLGQKRRILSATLNTLAYQPIDTEVPTIAATTLVPLKATQEELLTLAEKNRPALKAVAALIDKSQVNQQLAEREVYPDFSLSLEYMQRDSGAESAGDDMYSASVSFNLPVQHERRAAMLAESGAERRMLQEEGRMLRNQIRLAIAESLARLERNWRLAALYQDGLLGQAAGVLETTIASYQAGKTEFMKVLDSQMAVFNLERGYHEAVAEYQMQLAVLEALVGTGLPGGLE